jgi:endonuclease YncB( thermonuclease family)
VDAYGPDKYKRVLAVVWDGQVKVNLLMVAMGMPRYTGGLLARRTAGSWSGRRRRPGETGWECGRRIPSTRARRRFGSGCS